MIWLSRICTSCLLLPLTAATVTGRIELRDSREAAVEKRKDYSGVVVYLEPAAGVVKASHESRHAQMLQKNKTFKPHILAIEVGTKVDFPNLDPIFHNAFSTYDGTLFDVGLYPPGTSKSVVFARPGIVRVFCNIHADMSAVILVLNTPYFDTTKSDGRFEVQGVPPGTYTLRVFHERATSATLESAARSIAVTGDVVNLPPLIISESGYLPIPHKNKFGRDYPPAPDDGGLYPSIRK